MREKVLFLVCCVSMMFSSCIGGLQLRDGSGSGVLGVSLVMPSQIGSCQAVPIAGVCSPDGVDNVTISSLDFTEVTDFECDCASGAIGNCVDGNAAPVTDMTFCGTGPNENNPQVTATIEDEDGNTSSDEPPTEIVASSDLVTTKVVNPDPVVAGATCANPDDAVCALNTNAEPFPTQIAFDVMVENLGPDDNTGVSLTDECPTGTSFDAANSIVPAPTTYDGTIWTIGDLANGASVVLTIVCTFDEGALTENLDEFMNTATAAAGDLLDPDTTTDDLDAGVSEPYADLVTVKTLVEGTMPNECTSTVCTNGQVVTFSVVVENVGIADSPEAGVTDLCPAGTTYDVANPAVPTAPGTYTDTTGLWDTGPIANGAMAELLLPCTVVTSAGNTLSNMIQEASCIAGAGCLPDPNPTGDGDLEEVIDVTPGCPTGTMAENVPYYVSSIIWNSSDDSIDMVMDDGIAIHVERVGSDIPFGGIYTPGYNATQDTPFSNMSGTDTFGYEFSSNTLGVGDFCQELKFTTSGGLVENFGMEIQDLDWVDNPPGTLVVRDYIEAVTPIPSGTFSFYPTGAPGSNQILSLDPATNGFLAVIEDPAANGGGGFKATDGHTIKFTNLAIDGFAHKACFEVGKEGTNSSTRILNFFKDVCVVP